MTKLSEFQKKRIKDDQDKKLKAIADGFPTAEQVTKAFEQFRNAYRNSIFRRTKTPTNNHKCK